MCSSAITTIYACSNPLGYALPLVALYGCFGGIFGLLAAIEVHRDTCTETPEKVYEIAALYQKATGKKIRFCFDFSHIAVVKHLSPPYADRLLVRPDLVQLSRQVHYSVADSRRTS